MRYISFDVIFIVMAILAFTFFILGQLERAERIKLAEKVYSDPTCVLTQNTYKSVLSELVVEQVYKCSGVTYELNYDLSQYNK